MPVYQLTEELVFPNPEWANPEGLLAVGGDLGPQAFIAGLSARHFSVV